MAYTKQTFTAGQTLKASDLNTMSQGILDAYQLASLGGSGSASKELKILFIGNSLTQDAVSYLPLLLDEIAPEVKYTIYDWYNGGHTLAQQYSKFTAKTACENFGTITNNQEGGWTIQRNEITMDWVCQNCDFDVVVIQEYSYYDFDDATEVTNFNNVVNYLRTNYGKPFKVFSFIDAPMRTRIASDYEKAKKYAKLHVTKSVSEGIVNPGSAVIYALGDSTLNTLGDKGQLSSDGTHTQEGLPCMLQSYVLALWVFEWLGIPKSVLNSNTKMTADLYSRWASFGPNLGSGVVEGTDAQCERAKEIAIKAHKYGKQLLNLFLYDLADASDKPVIDCNCSGEGVVNANPEVFVEDSCLSNNSVVGGEYKTYGNQYTVDYDVYKVNVDGVSSYTFNISHGLYDTNGNNQVVLAVCNADGIVLDVLKAKLNAQTVHEEQFVVNMSNYVGASYVLMTVHSGAVSVLKGALKQADVGVEHAGSIFKKATAVGSAYEVSSSQYTTDYNIYKATNAANGQYSVTLEHGLYSSTDVNEPIIVICDVNGIALDVIRTATNVQGKVRVESYTVDMTAFPDASYFVFATMGTNYSVVTVG